MQGAADECDARGIGLSLISTLEKQQSKWTVSSALVDSFIVLCTEENDPVARLAVQRGLRTTTVDYPIAGHARSVVVDDFHGACLAAKQVITLGHQHIGVLTFSNDKDSGYYCGVAPERLRGCINACADAGIDENSLLIKASGPDADDVERAMDELLSENTNITALLCMSDRLALHAIDYAVQHGLRVPDDLSVVGFDDIPEASTSVVSDING